MAQVGNDYLMLRIPDDLPLISRYPPDIRQALEERIRMRDRNVMILSRVAAEVERLLKKEALHRIPQQDRFMSEIVIALDPSDIMRGDPLYKHEPVLRMLPEYTQVHVFAPEEFAGAARERLRALHLEGRARVYPVAVFEEQKGGVTITHTCVPWTQDLFRVSVNAAGHEYLFTPASYLQSYDLADPDIDYLDHLAASKKNRTVQRLPIFFHAGNILMGEARETTLFVGSGVLKFNEQMFFNAVQSKPSDIGVLELLKATSGVRHVQVLPNSRTLFHLDMAMAILDKGVAAVIDPLDSNVLAAEDRDVLQAIRRTLRALGFRIIPIPTVTSRMLAYQSPVNIVPFINRSDGKRYAFVPEFPDVRISMQGAERSLNRMIFDRYAEAGVVAVPVEDRYSGKKGDVHCVLKVIQ